MASATYFFSGSGRAQRRVRRLGLQHVQRVVQPGRVNFHRPLIRDVLGQPEDNQIVEELGQMIGGVIGIVVLRLVVLQPREPDRRFQAFVHARLRVESAASDDAQQRQRHAVVGLLVRRRRVRDRRQRLDRLAAAHAETFDFLRRCAVLERLADVDELDQEPGDAAPPALWSPRDRRRGSAAAASHAGRGTHST